MAIKRILCFGSMNIDYVYNLNDIVKEGETVSAKSRETNAGGKGLNQAIALSKAGAEPLFAGCMGSDGEILLDALKSANIDNRFVELTPHPSGHAIIQVDNKGKNCIIVYGGANTQIKKEYIDRVLAEINEGDYIILQNEINNIAYIMEEVYKKGINIVFNPSPLNMEIYNYPLDKVSIFNVNEHEGKELAFPGEIENEVSAEEIIARMSKRFPKAKILLTLGKNGAVFYDGKETFYQGIYDLPPVDTTAAGDSFTGFFLSKYLGGFNCAEALKSAAAAAALCVSRKGASVSVPTAEEVMLFLKEQN